MSQNIVSKDMKPDCIDGTDEIDCTCKVRISQLFFLILLRGPFIYYVTKFWDFF